MPDKNIEATLTEILSRLSTIEDRLGIQPSPNEILSTPEIPAPETGVNSSTTDAPKKLKPTYVIGTETPYEALLRDSAKQYAPKNQSGGQWLGSVGVLFFILAASFFIKLAIDSGWLTPIRQLGSIFLFGAFLNIAGIQLFPRDKNYSSLLPAAGIVILFMGAFAGHLYYDVYSAATAFILTTSIAFYCLFLFTLFCNEFFLIASIVGTFAIPPLLYPNAGQWPPLETYFIIWDLLYCVASIVLCKRLLIGLTAYLALIVFYGYTAGSGMHADKSLLFPIIFFQMVQFIIFGLSIAAFSMLKEKTLKADEAWALFPILIIFYITEYSLTSRYAPQVAPGLAILFAIMLYALYFMVRKYLAGENLTSEPVVLSFLSLTFFHAIYLEILPKEHGALFALILMGITGLLYAFQFSYQRYWPCYIAMYAVIALEYLQVLLKSGSPETIVFNFIFAAGCAGGYFVLRKENGFILSCAMLQALTGINHYAKLSAGPSVATFLTSGLWAILAFATLLVAYNIKDRVLAKSSVTIFGIVALKVLLFDISSSNGIGKVVALLIVGGLLYLGGLLLRQINQWSPISDEGPRSK